MENRQNNIKTLQKLQDKKDLLAKKLKENIQRRKNQSSNAEKNKKKA